jgi:Recombination endonuclease VII
MTTKNRIIDDYKNGTSIRKIQRSVKIPISQIKLILWDEKLYEPKNLNDFVKCRVCKHKCVKTSFTKLQIVNACYLCRECAVASNNKYQLKKFGLDDKQYNKILFQQNNCCAICKTDVGHYSKSNKKCRLAVDHDHKTGKVRGLLCNSCNRALGLLKDSITNLHSAIVYLKGSISTEKID